VLLRNFLSGRYTTIVLACLWFSAIFPTEQKLRSSEGQHGLCYSFMHNGDIWAVCEGKREHIALHGKASNYAISPDGAILALILEDAASGRTLGPRARLMLVDLKSQFKTTVTVTEFIHLSSTCGTILGYRGGSWTATDVLTGSVLDTSFRHFFACDSERHTVLGWNDNIGTSGRMVLRANRTDIDAGSVFLNGGRDFGVSPNGKFIAYFKEGSRAIELCTQVVGSAPDCVADDDEVGYDGVSVSDTGSVLHTGHTGEGCFYKDMAHFSKKPQPGYLEGDSCAGVYLRSPAASNPSLVEDLGRFPEWITPQTAAALREWGFRAKL
jgi:hypothetical protein